MAKKMLIGVVVAIVLVAGYWAGDQDISIPRVTWEANSPVAAPATVAATETPAAVPAAGVITFPATVWRGGVGKLDERYSVLFDPLQGGSTDHPAYGWYYQPRLPSTGEREAHEVALVLRGPANYRYTGPECTVYFNKTGKTSFDSGEILIQKENVLSGMQLVPTNDQGNEVWLFVKCGEGAGSGFSFEALTPLP